MERIKHNSLFLLFIKILKYLYEKYGILEQLRSPDENAILLYSRWGFSYLNCCVDNFIFKTENGYREKQSMGREPWNESTGTRHCLVVGALSRVCCGGDGDEGRNGSLLSLWSD